MKRLLKIGLSIPRTLWINFRYLPFRQAIRIPIWIANNVRIKELHQGALILKGNIKTGLIRIGYHEADGIDTFSAHTVINISTSGRLIFNNDAHIGQGAIIRINDGGCISLGQNFAISGTTRIIASKSITFGDNVQLSWDSLIMDSDAHQIFDEDGNWINPPKEIKIGNNVWIAANTAVLKGSVIGNNVIVSANSLINKEYTENNTILGGIPARPLKRISSFKI